MTKAFHSRVWALTIGLAALTLGAVSVPFVLQIWHDAQPIKPIIERVEVTPTNATGTWVIIYGHSVNTRCTRDIQHLLVERDAPPFPALYTMAFNESGPGLLPMPATYRNMLHIPLGFPPGQYDYYFRSVQICPPLGLVIGNTTLGPWPVTVGP